MTRVFSEPGPRLFALPPGVDFPRAFVAGCLERWTKTAPEDVARVTIYLNSERMRRAVRDALTASGARLLPRLHLVTDPLAGRPVAGLPQPVSDLRRKLELAQLVRPMLSGPDALAPRSTAFALAESLAELLAELQTEGIGPDALAALDVSSQSEHWGRALSFLSIINAYLAVDAQPDPAAAQRRAVDLLGLRWQARPPADPVIVAGSTGSRGTTALLMRLVGSLPQGAVVLPGFDRDLPGPVWDSLSDPMASEDHPQYRFRKVCDAFGLVPDDVKDWTTAVSPAPMRNRVVSLALRPAPVTDQWLVEGALLPDLSQAMEGVALIEAPTARVEALAIALMLREAAESGTPAALITPDRMLTRQVTAALDRWGILPDDSAGKPLGLSAPGRLVQQVAGLLGARPMLDAVLALLKHPLSFSGGDRADHLRLTRELELSFRRNGPVFPDGAGVLVWAGARKDSDAAMPWARKLAAILDTAARAETATLADHVAMHRALAEALARGEADSGTGGLWDLAPGQAVRSAMEALATDADAGGVLTVAEYADLIRAYLASGEVREPVLAHPGIRILGTVEARVLGAELVILGGLNEGVWPGLAAPDPWLNRQMRQNAGLLLPERRIGLAAHDFQLAAAAPRVVLTRAQRDAEAETVASRWVNRLTNLLAGLPDRSGPEALARMRLGGKVWVDRAVALERPVTDVPPAHRPSPRPPVGHRPKRLSLTRIERLIRNPYEIYARDILRLRPLDPLRPEPDPRLRGTVLHRILEEFVRARPDAEPRDAARIRFLALTSDILGQSVAWPSARLIWRARMEAAVDAFLAFDADGAGTPLALEEDGALPLAGGTFHLVGRPDRIDILGSGKALLVDYKTGAPPTAEQQRTYAKQLLLAAVMAEDGGFAKLGPLEVERIVYLGLKEGLPRVETLITPDLLADVRAGLQNLIARYSRPHQGYTARRAMFKMTDATDYDALSRFGEWDISSAPRTEDVR
ncbi:MAG: double-strand break repair protein AddB [Pseudomonadota bacterium]